MIEKRKNYTAQDIADYIVQYCNSKGEPISNLQLQKILYFVWIDYYKQNKEYLFDEEFNAWKLGPVIISVYNRYCVYGGMPIVSYSHREFPELDESLGELIDKYRSMSATELVNLSHAKDGAWNEIYNVLNKDLSKSDRGRIPFKLIIERMM